MPGAPGRIEHAPRALDVDVREQRAVGCARDHSGEMDDRIDTVEDRRQIARRDVDPMELEARHSAGRLAHVEADDTADSVHRVEVRKEALRKEPGDAGHRDRRGDHVHRLIG